MSTDVSASIKPPYSALAVIDALEAAGYEAYAVGGCVRDSLLGRAPNDWDVTTSALPDETMRIFGEPPFKPIPTGIAHGTVTVLAPSEPNSQPVRKLPEPIEVTTFRVDGTYSDHRRPDSVSFTRDITADLARRDFTVNAMAYSPRCGLIDPFGGRADLHECVLRAVGDPERRFCEDALRILRAARFASVLGFETEKSTLDAAVRLAPDLKNVARERLTSELVKLLHGIDAPRILRDQRAIITAFLPLGERAHSLCCEVTHLAKSLGLIDAHGRETSHSPSTALLISAVIAGTNALECLRLDRKTSECVRLIRKYRRVPITDAKTARILCRDLGRACALECAILSECEGTSPEESARSVKSVAESGCALNIAELAIKGGELKKMGVKPDKISAVMRELLDAVIDEPSLNTREILTNLSIKEISK